MTESVKESKDLRISSGVDNFDLTSRLANRRMVAALKRALETPAKPHEKGRMNPRRQASKP